LEEKYSEISQLSKEKQNLQSSDKFNWTSEKNPWLIFSIIILIFSSALIIFKRNWLIRVKRKN
jgi:uncharacterized membrane protein